MRGHLVFLARVPCDDSFRGSVLWDVLADETCRRVLVIGVRRRDAKNGWVFDLFVRIVVIGRQYRNRQPFHMDCRHLVRRILLLMLRRRVQAAV